MKVIQNTSLQGLYVPIVTSDGLKEIFLRPKATTSIPDSYQSKILDNFIRKRIIKVVRVIEDSLSNKKK